VLPKVDEYYAMNLSGLMALHANHRSFHANLELTALQAMFYRYIIGF
jgi:hypothetical protein